MKRIFEILLIFIFLSNVAQAQYISAVREYQPAPGQLINSAPWGVPASAQSIIGGIDGTLTLGAFGGYVVFEFDNPIQNHPDNPFGVDFTIFGNASQNWSEPGIVSVMKDENENGLPDDIWFELAGSDYSFSSTIKNYELGYFNPNQATASDVLWKDNQGASGFVYANAVHSQPYYPSIDSFPTPNSDSLKFCATRIQHIADTSNPIFINLYKRAFGYVDNQVRGTAPYTVPDNPYTPEKENSGGDAFDVSWAVDTYGDYVDLDEVHFVKVHNGALANAGWLGEVSTEITGAVDVEPNPNITGNLDLVVIKDLPQVIYTQQLQLEGMAFHQGRLQSDEHIVWETNMPGASIDENNLLTLSASGDLELSAYLENNPNISATVSASVDLSSAAVSDGLALSQIYLYPTQVQNQFRIYGVEDVELIILDVCGRLVFQIENYQNHEPVGVSGFKPGLYLVHIIGDGYFRTLKFVKE